MRGLARGFFVQQGKKPPQSWRIARVFNEVWTENTPPRRVRGDSKQALSGAVRQFAYWFAHGTLGHPLLDDIDYIGEILKEESSFAEQAFAIFMNNLELDEDGSVRNYARCEHRAAQYIRCYFDPAYEADPPFAFWEVELHPVSRDAYQT